LISHEVIVNLIVHTITQTGLCIHAELDTAAYPTGLKVPDEQMKALDLESASFSSWPRLELHSQTERIANR
jgi:hypothetical protein